MIMLGDISFYISTNMWINLGSTLPLKLVHVFIFKLVVQYANSMLLSSIRVDVLSKVIRKLLMPIDLVFTGENVIEERHALCSWTSGRIEYIEAESSPGPCGSMAISI